MQYTPFESYGKSSAIEDHVPSQVLSLSLRSRLNVYYPAPLVGGPYFSRTNSSSSRVFEASSVSVWGTMRIRPTSAGKRVWSLAACQSTKLDALQCLLRLYRIMCVYRTHGTQYAPSIALTQACEPFLATPSLHVRPNHRLYADKSIHLIPRRKVADRCGTLG